MYESLTKCDTLICHLYSQKGKMAFKSARGVKNLKSGDNCWWQRLVTRSGEIGKNESMHIVSQPGVFVSHSTPESLPPFDRPPQDVDILAVKDSEFPCSRPETRDNHPRRLLTKHEGQNKKYVNESLKGSGRRGDRRFADLFPLVICFSLFFCRSYQKLFHKLRTT